MGIHFPLRRKLKGLVKLQRLGDCCPFPSLSVPADLLCQDLFTEEEVEGETSYSEI